MMEYTSNRLSRLSGVSARTLRYYDEIGLLKPVRVATSGYRIYGQDELDTLQQILLYKELGLPLEEIKSIIYATDYDREKALHDHLAELSKRRERLDVLIQNVRKTISAMKGETIMTDNEKFEGFKQTLIDDNEQKYGPEIRSKYGDAAVDASNARLKGLTKEQYDEGERLRAEYEAALKAACEDGDPESEQAQWTCDLHRQWLSLYYPNYNREYHRSLADMYVADERFKFYYENIAPGCAEFLRDAIYIYCK